MELKENQTLVVDYRGLKLEVHGLSFYQEGDEVFYSPAQLALYEKRLNVARETLGDGYECEACGTTYKTPDRVEQKCIICGKEVCLECQETIIMVTELDVNSRHEVNEYFDTFPVCKACYEGRMNWNYTDKFRKLIDEFNGQIEKFNSEFTNELRAKRDAR